MRVMCNPPVANWMPRLDGRCECPPQSLFGIWHKAQSQFLGDQALTRMRIFQAIFQGSSKVQLQDEDYLRVVEFAIWRADHNGLMRTAKVVGWDKELFCYGGRLKLRAQLAKVDFDQAMTVALLASVSAELSVNQYNSTKAELLEALAKSFHVDTAAIRKQIAAEAGIRALCGICANCKSSLLAPGGRTARVKPSGRTNDRLTDSIEIGNDASSSAGNF